MMRKTAYMAFILFLPVLASCTKDGGPACAESGRVAFTVAEQTDGGFGVLDTKVARTETTAASIASFRYSILSGSSVWDGALNGTTTSDGTYGTDHWWPGASTTLKFYGVYPALDMSLSSGDIAVSVGTPSSPYDGATDYVAASATATASSPTAGPVAMSFSHILTWVYRLQVRKDDAAATVTMHRYTLRGPSYGTYSIGAGTWSGISARKTYTTYAKDYTIGTSYGSYSVIEAFVIPGTASYPVELEVEYTVTKGGVSHDETRSVSLTGLTGFRAGKKCTVQVTIPSDLSALTLSCVPGDWNGYSMGIIEF